MLKVFKFLAIFLIFALALNNIKATESSLRQLVDPSIDPRYDRFFYVRNIVCTTKNCIPPNICLDSATCKCSPGWSQFPDPSLITPDQNIFCQYQQKKQLTAFLLQFFLFLGIGEFYAGNTGIGVAQLLLCLTPCILSCVALCLGISMKAEGEARSCVHIILLIINCLIGCTLCGWWLADVIIFGMNGHTDGNGVPLQSW